MTFALLDRLQACHEELIGALDGPDAAAVEASVALIRDAVDELRAAGGDLLNDPENKGRAEHIAKLAEAARVRVNFLTDLSRQRGDALDAARGREAAALYGRDGSRGR